MTTAKTTKKIASKTGSSEPQSAGASAGGEKAPDFSLDPDASVHKAYGAWGTKKSYGKETTGVLRSTILIDKNGHIAKRFMSVKVDGHAEAVLKALRDL